MPRCTPSWLPFFNRCLIDFGSQIDLQNFKFMKVTSELLAEEILQVSYANHSGNVCCKVRTDSKDVTALNMFTGVDKTLFVLLCKAVFIIRTNERTNSGSITLSTHVESPSQKMFVLLSTRSALRSDLD